MPLLDKSELEQLPTFTSGQPMKILFSACLTGEKCGFDGSCYGDYPWIRKLMSMPNVRPFRFCPEHFSFGTPRELPDLHGGDGFDALDGRAQVLSDKGSDMTPGMIRGAQEMLHLAKKNAVDLAVMMDMSAACGSGVVSDGCRLVSQRKFRKGAGVAAALLLRNGFRVVSQRDFRTLEQLFRKLDPSHVVDPQAINHCETEWYRSYFGSPTN
jgi:uncharacterized protein YbbK (DUF523 family)